MNTQKTGETWYLGGVPYKIVAIRYSAYDEYDVWTVTNQITGERAVMDSEPFFNKENFPESELWLIYTKPEESQ